MLPETIGNHLAHSPTAAPVDRRGSYRAKVNVSALNVRVWKIAPGTPLSNAPWPSQEIHVAVRNIAIGGLGITMPRKGSELIVQTTDRLRIELSYEANSVLVEGRLRAVDAIQKKDWIFTGIHFDGNESNFGYHKARSTLSAIMGLMQREELTARRTAGEQEAAGNE